MATQTQRRAAVLALLSSIVFVDAARRPSPRAGSISIVKQYKSVKLDIINLRGGAIDDGRRPPPSSRYSSSYDDVGRYGREGHDNNSKRFDEYYDDRQSRDGRRSYPNHDERNIDNNDDKKSKGWFGRSKEEVNPSDNEQQSDQGNLWSNNNGGTGLPPPPPPPPPPSSSGASMNIDINPAETERTPIHYNFPSAEVAADERRARDTAMDASMDDKRSDDFRGNDEPDIPFIEEDELSDDRDRSSSRRRRRRSDDDDDVYSSARRDAVTTFMSTKRGAFKVRVGSVIVGAALGGFMGKVSCVDYMCGSYSLFVQDEGLNVHPKITVTIERSTSNGCRNGSSAIHRWIPTKRLRRTQSSTRPRICIYITTNHFCAKRQSDTGSYQSFDWSRTAQTFPSG